MVDTGVEFLARRPEATVDARGQDQIIDRRLDRRGTRSSSPPSPSSLSFVRHLANNARIASGTRPAFRPPGRSTSATVQTRFSVQSTQSASSSSSRCSTVSSRCRHWRGALDRHVVAIGRSDARSAPRRRPSEAPPRPYRGSCHACAAAAASNSRTCSPEQVEIARRVRRSRRDRVRPIRCGRGG